MASSSISSISISFKYDVFLSFRGEDTRNNFVGHFYEALQAKCIETYRDDKKIEQGERISNQLMKSIEESRFYIIIFSKNYASSSWCLDELVKIMECQKTTEHTAFTVFYDVEPAEVRKQYGPVGEAFSKHENQEATGKWRDAMKELADLAGWELKAIASGDESKLIQIIVVIFKKKYLTLSNADDKLVGMETRMRDVLSSLEISSEDVRMIGIKGIGGGGKTTLARAVYDRISTMFEGIEKALLKVVHDGKNMLKDMMCHRKTLVVLDDVDCIEQLEALAGESNWFKLGSRIIITTRDEQVLLAHGVNFVHDVNLLSHEEAVCLFSRYAFQEEIPTRGYEELSEQVVQYAHGLPLTIKVLGSFLRGQSEPYWLDAIERLKTIPLKATMKRLEISFDGLEDDYKEIFLDVACILKGKGKILEQKSLITYNEDGDLWMHDHLEEMGINIVRRSHPDEPQRHSRLWVKEEIEYILTNNLGTPATQFLYLDSPGFSAEIAIKGLAKMNNLKVLDIWVSRKCDDINWKFDKVSEYLPSSLRLMNWYGFPFSSLPNTFQGKHLVRLKLYESNIVELWEDGEEKGRIMVLNNLRFLTITHSKLRTFDLGLAPNLEQLTIRNCMHFVELHIPADHHSKLEHLDLSVSKLTNLHLGNTPNLKTLELEGCRDLVELQMPAESLKFQHLDLSHSKLTNLHIDTLVSKDYFRSNIVQRLDFDKVSEYLPSSLRFMRFRVYQIHFKENIFLNFTYLAAILFNFGKMEKKRFLEIWGSKLRTFDLRLAPNFESLTINGCYGFVELHIPADHHSKLEYLHIRSSQLTNLHLWNTPNLKTLKLDGCYNLLEFQMPAESLKLEHLDLGNSKLTNLHLGNTPNLKTLDLSYCYDLVELEMPAESLKLAFIDLNHSKLKTIHLGSTPNLEKLILSGCNDLIVLEMPSESLKLAHLDLSHSKFKTIHLGSTPTLKELMLYRYNDSVELEIPSECLKLEYVNLSHSELRKTFHLGSTPNLETLILKGCNDLVELELPFESLKLEELDLSHSKLKTLHLGNTPNLKTLKLEGCHDLVEFQMPAESLKLKHLNLSHLKLTNLHLGDTPNLEKLILKGCNDLTELLNNLNHSKLTNLHLGNTPNLEKLKLSHSKLKTIHLGSTPNLEELTLDCCNDLEELQMPECLKLKELNLSLSKMKTIHLGSTPNLRKLILERCHDLVEFQMPAESLNVKHLNLSHSKLTNLHLGDTPNLEKLILKGCNDLTELEMPSECLKLKKLYLSHSKLRTLDLGLTPNLEWLKLKNCYNLVELPYNICKLKHLKSLKIKFCWLLEKLPDEIGRLESLKTLILTDCKLLQEIPNSIYYAADFFRKSTVCELNNLDIASYNGDIWKEKENVLTTFRRKAWYKKEELATKRTSWGLAIGFRHIRKE
ncbi:Toll/interleukin-1 receptor domain-containing protein [Tanacetum coccineum]